MQEKPTFKYEEKVWRRDFRFVAGADEVGRGALAGPIVAGAVVFDSARPGLAEVEAVGIDDSKRLTKIKREELDRFIKKNCLAWGIGEVPVAFINRRGIVAATRCAFRRAIVECNRKLTLDSRHWTVDFLLVDAFYIPYVKGLRRKNQLAIVKGDQKSLSIAAASIVAKVYRDKLMVSLARCHLERLGMYGWERNKGYGTREHQTAIRRWGPTRLHRKLFIRKLLEK
jgi:ribonuclease HII